MNSISVSSKEIKSKQIFQYGNKIIEYKLIQSKRRKTMEVIVDKDQISIRAPFDKTTKDIEQILNDKMKWIAQKQKEMQNENPEIIKPSFDDYSILPYLGKNYDLKVIHTENFGEKIEFDEQIFSVFLNEKETEIREKTNSLYNNWLNSQANKIFQEKVNQYSRIIEVKPRRIITKSLKNRWGSVTKNNTINLNVNLIKAPEDIIDYIIIHELCHFKIQGHSYQFWDYLKQFVPNYKQKIEWLKRNSDNLLS